MWTLIREQESSGLHTPPPQAKQFMESYKTDLCSNSVSHHWQWCSHAMEALAASSGGEEQLEGFLKVFPYLQVRPLKAYGSYWTYISWVLYCLKTVIRQHGSKQEGQDLACKFAAENNPPSPLSTSCPPLIHLKFPCLSHKHHLLYNRTSLVWSTVQLQCCQSFVAVFQTLWQCFRLVQQWYALCAMGFWWQSYCQNKTQQPIGLGS